MDMCRFVFHAVGERELFLSRDGFIVTKKHRLFKAVQEGYVKNAQVSKEVSSYVKHLAISTCTLPLFSCFLVAPSEDRRPPESS